MDGVNCGGGGAECFIWLIATGRNEGQALQGPGQADRSEPSLLPASEGSLPAQRATEGLFG